MADAPNPPPVQPRPSAKCPHCDHVFDPAEVTDEWCAQCGKHIPEVLLKEIRPKPHLRHPHPIPEPTKADQAERTHTTKVRVSGLIVMLAAILGGIAALAWGAVNKIGGGEIGAAWYVGGAAGVAFLVGLVMLNTGGGQEE